MYHPHVNPLDEFRDELEPRIVSWVKDFPPCEEDEIAEVELRFLVRDGVVLDFDVIMKASACGKLNPSRVD
jgi:hypothetical protein